MIENAEEFQKMAAVEADLWWYRCLHERVLEALADRFGSDRTPAIVDAACGSGGLAARLGETGYHRVQAFDLSEHAIRLTKGRGIAAERCDVRSLAARLERSDDRPDAIILNDLVNYVPLAEWPTILRSLHGVLRPGGILIFNVAALAAFEGAHDRAVGLLFRIQRHEVATLADPALFTVRRQTYWPFALSPLIYAARSAQRCALRRHSATTNSTRPRSDVELPHPLLNRAFYGLTRLEQGLLPRAPWGSSLFLVLQKR